MGGTPNPVLYLDFADEFIYTKYDKKHTNTVGSSARPIFLIALRANEATRIFICCFGDIIKDYCGKIQIHTDFEVPPSLWGAIMPGLQRYLPKRVV